MGGKTSKEITKKNKTEKGEKNQGKKKERKERAENGDTATEKPVQNETTAAESEDKDTLKVTEKNESEATDIERIAEDGSPSESKNETQQVPVTESLLSSETASAETQPAAVENSSQHIEENKKEPPTENSVEDTESEEPAKEEVQEKLEKSQEKLCPQEPATEEKSDEAEPSAIQMEQILNNLEKAGEEGESIPATSLNTPETGAANNTAGNTAEVGEITVLGQAVSATVPTEFKWEDGGETVLISGSFDGWQEKIALVKNGDIFTKTLDLPIGEHLYRFFVDEQWIINKHLPSKCDEDGLEKNVLLVQPVT